MWCVLLDRCVVGGCDGSMIGSIPYDMGSGGDEWKMVDHDDDGVNY